MVAYRATWPDELIVECTVGTLAETVRARKLWKHTLFLVGPALAAFSAPALTCTTQATSIGSTQADRQARLGLRAAAAFPPSPAPARAAPQARLRPAAPFAASP